MVDSARTPFPPHELARWRARLVEQARILRADVDALEAEAVLQVRVAPNHHLVESATELQSSEIDASAAAADQDLLRQVLAAIDKIDGRGAVPYGICEITGDAIELERLELMPWTPLSAAGGDREAAEQRAAGLPEDVPLR